MYDWDEYLTLAFNLLDNDNLGVNENTRCRVAISRAYYAVFHNAKHLCSNRKELRSVYDQGKGEHDKIYNKLLSVNTGNSEFKSACHSIANEFKLLKKNRKQADYEANYNINFKQARLLCKRSQRLIEKIKQL